MRITCISIILAAGLVAIPAQAKDCLHETKLSVPAGKSVTFTMWQPRDEVGVVSLRSNRSGAWKDDTQNFSANGHGPREIPFVDGASFSASRTAYHVDVPGHWLWGSTVEYFDNICQIRPTVGGYVEIDYYTHDEPDPDTKVVMYYH